jgi:uncharacterized protein involved in type VI secretion and phage assembly
MFDTVQDRELMGRASLGYGGLFYGVYPALVTNVVDPAGMGQVQVQLPWSPDTAEGTYQVWARMATLMAGNNRGSWFIPEVGDEVLVTFAAGNPRYPILLGALWNGKDAPPVAMDQDGKNAIKRIRSRSGIEITLDDTEDKPTLSFTTPGKQQAVFTDDAGRKGIQVTAGDQCQVTVADGHGNSAVLDDKGITLADGSQNQVTMGSDGITLKVLSGATITLNKQGIALTLASGAAVQLSEQGFTVRNVPMASVQAEGSFSLTASDVSISGSIIGLTAGIIDAAGVINCPTIIAEAVVGTSYTPGPGNLM